MRFPTFACVFFCILLLSGCEKGPRREGIGGGAFAPVSIRLLLDEAPEKSVEPLPSGATAETSATVKGQVKVLGTASQMKFLTKAKRTVPGAKIGNEVIADESILVSETGGLANVFVYLTPLPNANVIAAKNVVEVQVRDFQFTPRNSIVQVGQKVKFLSEVEPPCRIRLTGVAKSLSGELSKRGASLETDYSLAEPYPVTISSPSFPFMHGFQLVVDHPWAAVTKGDGSFEIDSVPNGARTFVVWHEKFGALPQLLTIDVPESGSVEKALEIPASLLLSP